MKHLKYFCWGVIIIAIGVGIITSMMYILSNFGAYLLLATIPTFVLYGIYHLGRSFYNDVIKKQ